MKSYGKFPLSYLFSISSELYGQTPGENQIFWSGLQDRQPHHHLCFHQGPCFIYCLPSSSWDVWGNGLANNSLLQHKPWFISLLSFSNSAGGQNARCYNSVLLMFANKIPLDYFLRRKMKKQGLPAGGNLLSFTYPTSKTWLWEKQGIPSPFELREVLTSVYMQHFPLWASPDGGWGKWVVRESARWQTEVEKLSSKFGKWYNVIPKTY